MTAAVAVMAAVGRLLVVVRSRPSSFLVGAVADWLWWGALPDGRLLVLVRSRPRSCLGGAVADWLWWGALPGGRLWRLR